MAHQEDLGFVLLLGNKILEVEKTLRLGPSSHLHLRESCPIICNGFDGNRLCGCPRGVNNLGLFKPHPNFTFHHPHGYPGPSHSGGCGLVRLSNHSQGSVLSLEEMGIPGLSRWTLFLSLWDTIALSCPLPSSPSPSPFTQGLG